MIAGVLVGVLSLASLGAGPQNATGSLHGRVLSAETGTPIRGATVRVRHGGTFRFLLTDDNGRYRAGDITAGEVAVYAYALGHSGLEVTVVVPEGADVPLDLELALRPIPVAPLLTTVESARLRLPPPGLVRGGLREEGETELRALEATPGVAELGLNTTGPDPTDPTSILYVRGAVADLKLVLLDGAPVYAPFHLSGLMDAFPDGVLRDATLYMGGTPARYDGGLSYVLDLDVREGDADRIRSAGAVDLLGATGRIEGPIGSRARFLLGGRGLHGAGYPVIGGDSTLPYGYGDALGRIDVDVGAGHLAATGFWNRESVALDLGKIEDAAPEGAVPEDAFWGNTAGSARFDVPLWGGDLQLISSYGRFTTLIPALTEGGRSPGFTTVRGETARSRTGASYGFGERVRWSLGAGFDTHETILDERTVFGDTTAHTIGRAHTASLWGEAAWDVSPALELRAGVRASYYRPEDVARFAPRLSALWRIDERARLKVAAGRFYQIVRGPETILSSDLTGPTVGGATRPILDQPSPVLASQLFAIAGATHLVVGLENTLPNGLGIGIEGYFKSFDGIPDTDRLYSSGADLWIQAEEGPVRGWIGYSLAWVWTDDAVGDREFVGRQLLSGGLGGEVRGFDLGLRLTYGAGLPFADVSTDGSLSGTEGERGDAAPALSGAPDDSYLRLDAEISRRVVGHIGQRRFEIAPYVRLLNALDRRDALFYRTTEQGPATPAALSSVPVLAIFGLAWTF